MILGRSLTLGTGAVAAVINAVVLAVLALIAANDGLAVSKGRAAAARIAATRMRPSVRQAICHTS